MFKLNELSIKHKEIIAPIESVKFSSSGGRDVEIISGITSIEIRFSDHKASLMASFNKADLAEYIKLLTVLHDQLK